MFEALWDAVGAQIADRLVQGQGVALPQFGTFMLLPALGSNNTIAPGTRPAFTLDRRFAADSGATPMNPQPLQRA